MKEKIFAERKFKALGPGGKGDPFTDRMIELEGEKILVLSVYRKALLPLIDLGSKEYYVAETEKDAGEAAVRYWLDMRTNDPDEFAYLIGTDTFVAWGCGRKAGPGAYPADGLEDWLENAVRKHPQTQFAVYDGQQMEVRISAALAEELGFDERGGEDGWVPVVAYRHN